MKSDDLISRSAMLGQIRPENPGDCRSAVLLSDAKKIFRNFLEEAPAVDTVKLPKGKIGDVIKWNNGVSFRYFVIHSIVICCDGLRYDLGEFMPFVTDSRISAIMTQEEAETVLGRKDDG